jgi:molybdenum cofactor biosynthesis enzyme MoaA
MKNEQNLGVPKTISSCFWGHNWTKWEQFEREMIDTETNIGFVRVFQKRFCKKCNKMAVNKVRF